MSLKRPRDQYEPTAEEIDLFTIFPKKYDIGKDITESEFTESEFNSFINDIMYHKPNKLDIFKHHDNIIQNFPENIQSLYKLFINSKPTLTDEEKELRNNSYSKPWFDYIIPKLKYEFDKYFNYQEELIKYDSNIRDLHYCNSIMFNLSNTYIKQYYIASKYDPTKINKISCKYHSITKKIKDNENKINTLNRFKKVTSFEFNEFIKTREYLKNCYN